MFIFMLEILYFINMVDITKLKTRVSLEKLKDYKGSNDYLLSLKRRLDTEGFFVLTNNQANYIENNFYSEPIKLNQIVDITEFLGESLKEKYELSHTPKKILVEYVLAENDKSYHVKGKLYKNQKHTKMFYLPKTQLNKNLLEEEIKNIKIDFNKYYKLDKRGWKAFKHQKEGIKFLLSKNKCIMGDDMGLGKTYMSIIAALENNSKKILVICPANAKINWFREISNFVPEEDISIIKTGHWNPKKFTIINYDILKNFHTLVDGRKKYKDHEMNRHLANEGFDLMIIDECHMAKNPKSQRTKVINQLSNVIEKKWLLTGTPIANRPMDFYNLLLLCDSPITNSWKYYAFRYCAAKKFRKKTKNGMYRDIWITDGASNLEELHERTKSLILRRKKEDHLDLPPKIVAPYYIEIDDMDQYHRVFDEYLEWAKSEGKNLGAGRHMVELIVLRKYLALEKTKQSIELAEQAIENGKKVIIFTNFTHSFDYLIDHFGKIAVGHNGKLNDKQKQRSIDEFQENDNIKVFIGNLISAGTAITLTKAEIVVMNDLDFVPSNHAQAEDRAWRIGTTETVNVYYPIAVGTIDEMIYKMLEKKRKIINTITGDEHESIDITDDLFSNFIA